MRLATLCQAVFEAAQPLKECGAMKREANDGGGQDLVAQVVAACQAMIERAIGAPSEAMGIAMGLDSALTTLKLVQSEIGKGKDGAPAIVGNAAMLTQGALADVLRHSNSPSVTKRALKSVPEIIATIPMAQAEPPIHSAPPASRPGQPAGGKRSFGEISTAYIRMRVENDGADHRDIANLRRFRQTFIDVIGDRPIDQYTPADLQTYVAKMQFWPSNASKIKELQGLGTLQILEANKHRTFKPLGKTTLKFSYVGMVGTMARFEMMGGKGYLDPFAGAKIRWPKILAPSKPREGLGTEVVNQVFALGVASGYLDEAMLPLLAFLTTRRLALLLFLRAPDIRQKHGVWIAQTGGVVKNNGIWQRVPFKTDESVPFFVLHNFLVKIGFVEWARQQDGWIFEEAHEHPNPSKYESAAMGRLLARGGASKGSETFHGLRGDAITDLRDKAVQPRAARLQAGHELGDVHDNYGSRELTAEECRRLANKRLPKDIDWSVFENLDLDALAKARHQRGKRRG